MCKTPRAASVVLPAAVNPVCRSGLAVAMLFLMPNTLVECVPNFSEGRDGAKVDAIVEAMKIPGVYLLDREMDSDHNRCVITLVGEREAIEEAAIRGVGKAAELIDRLLHHRRDRPGVARIALQPGGGEIVRRRGLVIGGDDIRARRAEHSNRGGADTRRGPGNQDPSALQRWRDI